MKFNLSKEVLNVNKSSFQFVKTKKIREFLQEEEELIKKLEHKEITIEQFKKDRKELLGSDF